MSIITHLKLDESTIPCVPFIWYREEELVCPIDHVEKVKFSKIKKMFDLKENANDDECVYVIIQRNVSDSNNLYVCLHSLLYYELHKSHEMQNDMLTIPNHFNHNVIFEVMMTPLGDSEIKEIPGGLKANNFTPGSVFIHNCAFSPPGCLHFKVDLEKQCNIFLCSIKCIPLNINIYSLFVLFNDLKGTDIETEVKNMITKFEHPNVHMLHLFDQPFKDDV